MFQSLIYSQEYIDTIQNRHILIDNTFLVDLSKDTDDELTHFLEVLRSNGCILVTIKEVFQEFARGAKDMAQYNKYIDLFKALGIKLLSKKDKTGTEQFVIAYNNSAKKASLTDLKLALQLFKYAENNLTLLTANYYDMPPNLLKRESIIAYDMRGQIRTHGFYGLQKEDILNATLAQYDNRRRV